MLHAPHGAICARLLPLVMDANLKVLEARQPEHPAVARYAEAAQILMGDKNATASDGVKWVSDLAGELNIPSLSALGMNVSQISEAVEKTLKSSSYKGNPIPLSGDELKDVVGKAM